MALIGRIFVIFFALVLAALAAGMVIAFGVLGPQWHSFSGDVVERSTFWVLTIFASGFTISFGLLPLVIAVTLAEAARIRSLLIYLVAGAALMAAASFINGVQRFDESIDHPPPPISRETELAAAAGAMFGLVYWLIAGRKAGAWRRSARAGTRAGTRTNT